jgi:CDP-glucose 4,6-dehydratase
MEMKRKQFWKNRPVLVTGGTGFVGFWLASTLAKEGAKVYLIGNHKPHRGVVILDKDYVPKMKFTEGSITNKKIIESLIRRHKIQTIFHLAAEALVERCYEDPERTLEVNVRGTWVVLEAARKYGVKEIIVASSDKAYGSHKVLPYDESYALQGRNPYDCSKSCADLIAQMYGHSYQLPVGIIRSANIYGGGDLNWSRLIPEALRSVYMGKTFVIRSDGTFKRDYLYVQDVVDAYMRFAEEMHAKKLFGEAFNLGTNKPLSVLKVLAMIEKATGKSLEKKILGRGEHEIRDQYLAAKKIQKVLGWKPTHSPQQGFEKTTRWYKRYFDANTR